MEHIENVTHRYGLVGKNISYSFSRGYFSKKFSELGLHGRAYENFDLQNIADFPKILEQFPDLKGLNVTIPYKQTVIPFLSRLDSTAQAIGAVNTINPEGQELVGYNTDAYGFRKSLEPFLKKTDKKALILGTGGASKAVAYVLGQLNIAHVLVSRNPVKGQLGYDALDRHMLEEFQILVNCTPLGTFPRTGEKPPLPYGHITSGHLLYDLIYNPAQTAFLKEGASRGARISNGLRMLELQAEKAWEIWNGQSPFHDA